jgi:transposase
VVRERCRSEEAAEKVASKVIDEGLVRIRNMRGHDEQQERMFSYISAEQRVPRDHPLRRIRSLTDSALQAMSPQFARLYSSMGRPSIAPEKLLRTLLLQAFYSVRSERLLMEQLSYNLLFRWFVGLQVDEPVWDVTVFTKNRARLLEGEIAQAFFAEVLAQAGQQGLLADEHFTVDGTLIEAWANRRSFQPKNPPPSVGSGSKGELLLRDTHESTSDAESAVPEECRGRKQAQLFGSRADGKPPRAGAASDGDAGRAQGGT